MVRSSSSTATITSAADRWLDGPQRRIPAVGVPSASEASPGEHDPAGYNLYRIEGDTGAWRCEVVSRGLTPDGKQVVEIKRMLAD